MNNPFSCLSSFFITCLKFFFSIYFSLGDAWLYLSVCSIQYFFAPASFCLCARLSPGKVDIFYFLWKKKTRISKWTKKRLRQIEAANWCNGTVRGSNSARWLGSVGRFFLSWFWAFILKLEKVCKETMNAKLFQILIIQVRTYQFDSMFNARIVLSMSDFVKILSASLQEKNIYEKRNKNDLCLKCQLQPVSILIVNHHCF